MLAALLRPLLGVIIPVVAQVLGQWLSARERDRASLERMRAELEAQALRNENAALQRMQATPSPDVLTRLDEGTA